MAGDGRFDSPGFSAKYMTYTFMEMDTNQVVYFVQVCLGEASISCFQGGFFVLLVKLRGLCKVTVY